jgi:beta-glucuronidase
MKSSTLRSSCLRGMTRVSALLIAALLPITNGSSALSAQAVIQSAPIRADRTLDGAWHTIIDPYETGYYDYRYQESGDGYFRNLKPASVRDLVEYDFDASDVLNVPGDWNTQDERLFFYEGTIWYKKSFAYDLSPGRRLFVHFGAANYETVVYLNGAKLGSHIGGFTSFDFELTDLLRDGDNDLIVKVDNKRLREGVPTVNTDWWNYGGLTRSVSLVDVPSTFVSTYYVGLSEAGTGVSGWAQLDGDNPVQTIQVRVPELGSSAMTETDSTGFARFEFEAAVERWSPENPRLYSVEIASPGEVFSEEIGFRSVATRGEDILLNGEPVFLKGISIHEEAPFGGGRAHSLEHARQLLTWAKELGCNFVRLAHYPHNEHMVREADRLGIMVWSEIPVYWTVLFDNEETYANASRQLAESIQRDRNRASVIIWSVANETPRSAARLEFLTGLIAQAREMDGTRLISAATELTDQGDEMQLNDPLCAYLDVIGVNEYFGWYSRRPEDIPPITWRSSHNKPLIISEFGAGAKHGYHASDSTRWSEEYQANVYRYQLPMLEKISFLRGMSPWILVDFRSPRRPLPGIQDFWNRKGLISEEGERKLAFNVLRQWYEER